MYNIQNMTLKGGKKVKKKSLNKKTVKKNYKKSQKHSNKGKKYSIKKKRKMEGGTKSRRSQRLKKNKKNYKSHLFEEEQYQRQLEAERKALENPRRKSTVNMNPYPTRGRNKKPKNFNPEHYDIVTVDNTSGPRPPGSIQIPADYDPTHGGELYQHANYGNMTAGSDLYEAVGIATGREQAPWDTLNRLKQYKYEETARLLQRLSQQI